MVTRPTGHATPMASRPAAAESTTRLVHTDLLFDSKKKKFVTDTSFEVDTSTGLITKVFTRSKPLSRHLVSNEIDLRGKTVLPGLVDAHTHIYLHSYLETPSLYQERDESLVERTIRATNHCRTALLAGYTTYRDLGTEGAYDSDVHVRDAVNRGIIPGPRIFCATECLTSSGGYEIRTESRGNPSTLVPRLSDPVDGVDACRAGVRRRLGAGADVIKIYADYRKRELRFPQQNWPGAKPIIHPPGGISAPVGSERSPNLPLFTQVELDAMVEEAKRGKAPVAIHASWPGAVIMAAKAKPTSVEHGFIRSDEAIEALRENGVIFVPTLSIVEMYADDMTEPLEQTRKAWEAGIKLAAGGDTGGFPHGENFRELELMVKGGVPLEEVLTAATLHGFEACGGDWCGRKFGVVEGGWAADIVALDGDIREDIGSLRKVDFVMKDAVVWKQDGQAKGMV